MSPLVPSPGPEYVLNERGEWVRSGQFNPLQDGWRRVDHLTAQFTTTLLAGASDSIYDAVASSTRADSVNGYSVYIPWGGLSGGSNVMAFLEPSPGASLLPLRENTFYRVRIASPRVHVFLRHMGVVGGTIRGVRYFVGQTHTADIVEASPVAESIIRQTVTVAVPGSGTASLVNEMGTTGTGITARGNSDIGYWDFAADREIRSVDVVASGAGTVNGAYLLLNNVAYGAPASSVSLNYCLNIWQAGAGILGTSTPDAVGGVPSNISAYSTGGSATQIFPVRAEGIVLPILSYNTAGGAVTFSISVRVRGRIPGLAPVDYYWNLPPV